MVTTSQLLIATIFKIYRHTLSLPGWGYEIFQCRNKRNCPLFTFVHTKWVSVKWGSTVVQKKMSKLKWFHLNNYTFWVQRWTLSFSNVLKSDKTAKRSREAYVKRRLYCDHHHSSFLFPDSSHGPWTPHFGPEPEFRIQNSCVYTMYFYYSCYLFESCPLNRSKWLANLELVTNTTLFTVHFLFTYLLFISPSLFIYFFLVGHGPGQKWRVHGPLVHVLSSLPGGQGFNLNS